MTDDTLHPDSDELELDRLRRKVRVLEEMVRAGNESALQSAGRIRELEKRRGFSAEELTAALHGACVKTRELVVEECVAAAVGAIRHSQQTTDQCRSDVAAAIRARGK